MGWLASCDSNLKQPRSPQKHWRHLERRVIFWGDFVAWYLPDAHITEGDYLRSHFSKQWGAKNRHQHAAFLHEVEGKPVHGETIEWFLTLPLWLDLPQLRVVHACWHSQFIEYLRPRLVAGSRLSKELMVDVTTEPNSADEQNASAPTMFTAVETLTKGLEIALPDGHTFSDKYGIARSRVRARWWDPGGTVLSAGALLEDELKAGLPDTLLPQRWQATIPLTSRSSSVMTG